MHNINTLGIAKVINWKEMEKRKKKKEKKKSSGVEDQRKHTIRTKRSSSNGGELFAGVNVLEDGLIQTREMLVALFKH